MATKERRARGTGSGRVGFYAELDPDVKATLDAASKNLAVPKWRLLEELVRHAQLRADERPAWWPQETDQEELPLDKAS